MLDAEAAGHPTVTSIPSPPRTPSRSSPESSRRALTIYMDQIRRVALLDAEAQRALALRVAHHGDREAARTLFRAHLRFVARIAFEYAHAARDVMDLVQEGNMGLLRAIERFDPERGVRLTTYASWWIRAYILRYAVRDFRLVKIGTTTAQRQVFYRLSRETAQLAARGIEPTAAALGKRMSVKASVVEEMEARLSASEASIDAPRWGRGDAPFTLADTLRSSEPLADEALSRKELEAMVRERLEAFAARLDERERDILDARLLADPPRTLQSLARRYGVSRQRIQQIESGLRRRLRSALARGPWADAGGARPRTRRAPSRHEALQTQ